MQTTPIRPHQKIATICLLALLLPARLWGAEVNYADRIAGLDVPVRLADGTETRAINFDNAATTPAFKSVLQRITDESGYYASIGRGRGQKSAHSTAAYQSCRDTVLRFFGADNGEYEVIFVNNTTDGLNRLATMLLAENGGEYVLTSRMEHHANDLPWRAKTTVLHAEVDEKGRLDIADLERLLQENEGKVGFVTLTAASNVTGYENDIHRVARLAHQYGAKMIVDGAQIAAHRRLRMIGDGPEADIDFFVFSAHKMYAPFGGGAIIGRKADLAKLLPAWRGGATVDVVSDEAATLLPSPDRHEAGSPNYFGVIAMQQALEELSAIGWDYIEDHERRLMAQTLGALKQMPEIELYGDCDNYADRVGIVVFNVKGVPAGETAQFLADTAAIATRQGAFCSHPYVARLMGVSDEYMQSIHDDKIPSMVRVSFGVYTTPEEVDILLDTLRLLIAEKTDP